jgi:K(+)-stimulated pyrophosphate-energized sodium pump
MANAGGAWDNAKKCVEVELQEKGTATARGTVVGDTVGDPFKDTSSVAMNPSSSSRRLFGLLAVELALELSPRTNAMLSAVFFAISMVFAWRSFYAMRIGKDVDAAESAVGVAKAAGEIALPSAGARTPSGLRAPARSSMLSTVRE